MATQFGRSLRVLGAVALLGSASLVMTGPASAADSDAVIRGAHFSPTTPGVDVYLGAFSGKTSKIWLHALTYGSVSGYQRIAPGLYTVAMRSAGASASTAPVLSWTLNARAGKAYTVAGVGAGASVRGIVIGDDLSTPPAGKGRVRVIQAASRAPVATVKATNGPVIAAKAPFATATAYADVPAGTWTLSAQSADTATEVSTSAPVAVKSGVSTSVLLLDAQSSGITLRTVLDSSSSGTAPVGSVSAGGGGMAGLPALSTVRSDEATHWAGVAGLGSIAALSVLLGAGALRRRHSDGRDTVAGERHAAG